MMRPHTLTAAVAAVSAALTLAPSGSLGGSEKKAEEYVPEVETKALYQGELPGIEKHEMIVKHFVLPPGYEGDRHQHPGPVFVYVLEGELTVETQDGITTVKAGELYPEPLNVVMQGKNMDATNPASLLVFQVGEIGKPMMTKVD